MNIFDLTGKVILVTGGAGHLGTAMSRALVRAGAEVVIASTNENNCKNLAEQLSRELQGKARGRFLDISSKESAEKCIEEVVKESGKIDVLVNNAAFSVAGYFEDLDEGTWKEGIEGTINSVYRMTSAIIPQMVKQGYGNIINISSMYGVVSPNPKAYHGEVRFNNPACYGAGKAAVLQFSRYIAGYYGEKNIRCNCIVPGPFPSPEVQETQWFINELNDRTMLKRIGRPEDLEGALIYFASDSSSFVTGASLCIDGGWTAW